MDAFFSALWSGIVLGALYSIMAIGLTVVYGVSRVFNFAHGHVAVIGGYITWLVIANTSVGILGGAIAGSVAVAVIGWLLYQAAIRPLLKRETWAFSTLAFTLGFAILVQFGLLELFGPRVKAIPRFFPGSTHLWFGPITYHQVSICVIALALMGVVWAFLFWTVPGRAMRAVSSSVNGARIVGVNVERIYGITFAFAFLLTGLSGVLLASHYYMTPHIGWNWMMKGFTIVVFGGLGSVPGAILGAFVLGIIETMVSLYLGMLWVWPAWLVVFIVVLAVRPQGLLGGRTV